jgi:hypothetical protein
MGWIRETGLVLKVVRRKIFFWRKLGIISTTSNFSSSYADSHHRHSDIPSPHDINIHGEPVTIMRTSVVANKNAQMVTQKVDPGDRQPGLCIVAHE